MTKILKKIVKNYHLITFCLLLMYFPLLFLQPVGVGWPCLIVRALFGFGVGGAMVICIKAKYLFSGVGEENEGI